MMIINYLSRVTLTIMSEQVSFAFHLALLFFFLVTRRQEGVYVTMADVNSVVVIQKETSHVCVKFFVLNFSKVDELSSLGEIVQEGADFLY